MSEVHDALAAAIAAASRGQVEPEPEWEDASVDDVAEMFEEGRHTNRAIADAAGVNIRTVQRWRKGARGEGGEVRDPSHDPRSRAAVAKLRGMARRRWRRRRGAISGAALARRNGVDMQLGATIRVSQVWKYALMPKYAPAIIGPELMGPVMDVYDAGRDTGGVLLAAFFESYWGNAAPADVGEIEFVSVVVR